MTRVKMGEWCAANVWDDFMIGLGKKYTTGQYSHFLV